MLQHKLWFLLLVATFMLSLVLTVCVRRYALAHLLDVPNDRSSHVTPAPTGGGLGIVVAFLASLLLIGWLGWISHQISYVLLAGIPVAAIGFWDDHQPVSARWRIVVHLIVAVAAVLLLQGFPDVLLGDFSLRLGFFGYVVGAGFLVWSLNLFNFMDGIDGIAASEAIFVLAGLMLLNDSVSPELSGVLLLLMVACCGFLLLNWPAAKIFMGDIGSGYLGFALGALILLSALEKPVLLFSGLILYAVFVVDATVTLLTRYKRGRPWYAAHCSHAYQHLARQYGHLRVVLGIWLVNLCWLLPLAFLAFFFRSNAWAILLLAYLPLVFAALKFKAGVE